MFVNKLANEAISEAEMFCVELNGVISQRGMMLYLVLEGLGEKVLF